MVWIETEGEMEAVVNCAMNSLGFIKHGKFRDWLNDCLQVGFCFVESSCRKGSWFDPRRGIARLYADNSVILPCHCLVGSLTNGELERIWKDAVVS